MNDRLDATFYIDEETRTGTVSRLSQTEAIRLRARLEQIQHRVQRRLGLKRTAATPEILQKLEDEELKDVEASETFLKDQVVKYVILAGQEGAPDLPGPAVVELYGASLEILRDLVNVVALENSLGPIQKKTWRSQRALEFSLTASQRAAETLGKQRAIAALAPTPATKPTAAATASIESPSSGTTAI